jgi:predicted amino acid-binding ACT domain protein
MLLVTGDEGVIGKLRHEQSLLAETSGLQVDVRPTPATPPRGAGAGGGAAAGGRSDAIPFRFVATAVDRAGIVHRISHLLRELNVNIESLETRLTAAPYTGAPVFEMESILAVPRSTPVAQVRQQLAAMCDEMNMDWELKPA